MVEQGQTGPGLAPPPRVGDRLREAREAQGLVLADIAQRTRIPLRHLEAVESSSYTALPSITYAMGFTRAYARAVGADEVGIARDLRGELATSWEAPPRHEPYDPSDPARVPPRGLAVAGVIVFLVLLAGIGLWYGTALFRGDGTAPVPAEVASAPGVPGAAVPAPAAPAPSPTAGPGQVTLTATDEVWVRVYDANNDTLLIKTLQPGERYDVPPGADRPMINIGRPDQVTVTVDGQQLPPLGPGDRPIKDVEISAQALRARAAGASPNA